MITTKFIDVTNPENIVTILEFETLPRIGDHISLEISNTSNTHKYWIVQSVLHAVKIFDKIQLTNIELHCKKSVAPWNC